MGNLVQVMKAGGEAWALTTPLIKKADGTKFGKTEKGNLWLDPKRTSRAGPTTSANWSAQP